MTNNYDWIPPPLKKNVYSTTMANLYGRGRSRKNRREELSAMTVSMKDAYARPWDPVGTQHTHLG